MVQQCSLFLWHECFPSYSFCMNSSKEETKSVQLKKIRTEQGEVWRLVLPLQSFGSILISRSFSRSVRMGFRVSSWKYSSWWIDYTKLPLVVCERVYGASHSGCSRDRLRIHRAPDCMRTEQKIWDMRRYGCMLLTDLGNCISVWFIFFNIL